MPDRQSPSPVTSRKLFFQIFPCIMLPMFLAVSEATLVASALPGIAAEFGSSQFLTWIIVAFMISNSLMTPVYGRLGDLLGRRSLMLVALALLIFGAIISVTAQRIEMLILGRAVQGLGGGGMMSLSQALIGQILPLRERGKVQGYLSAVSSVGTIAGPIYGSLATHYIGWRAALGISIPLAAIAFTLALKLPVVQRKPSSGKFDFLGLFLFAAAILPIFAAIQFVQSYGFAEMTYPTLLGALAGVAVIALVWRERRARNPLFPPKIIARPAVYRSALATATYGACFVSIVAFTPLYLHTVRGLTGAEVGILLLTLTIGSSISSAISGNLVSRTGLAAIIPAVGMTGLSLFMLALAMGSAQLPTLLLPVIYFGMSLCFGTVMAVMQLISQHAAGAENVGIAASTVQFARNFGATLGTAVVGAVLFMSLDAQGPEAAAIFRDLLRGISVEADTVSGLVSQIDAAFRYAFLTIAVMASLGAAICFTIPFRRFSETDFKRG